MRYVPVSNLQQGMTLGQAVYDINGRLLLAKYSILSNEYINGLERMGLPGIYCEDEISKDIEVNDVLRPEVRREAVKIMRDYFTSNKSKSATQDNLHKVVINIVDDILSNHDVMYNIVDLKTYDDYTYYHSVNASVISTIIGAGLSMNRDELNILATTALLHDVGKRFCDIDILNAQRKLTPEEFNHIKQHSRFGFDLLRDNYNFSSKVYAGVLQHHEFYNGTGYPMGKSGKEISSYARIIKIADVYDALVSKRPYHDPASPSEAVEYIMSRAMVEFDPEYVNVFLRKVAVYPVGCEVVLSNGKSGLVVENHNDSPLRPIIKILDTKNIIDLNTDVSARSITIIKLVV